MRLTAGPVLLLTAGICLNSSAAWAYNYGYSAWNYANATPFFDHARWYEDPLFLAHVNLSGTETSCGGSPFSLQEDFLCATDAYNQVDTSRLDFGRSIDNDFPLISEDGHNQVAGADLPGDLGDEDPPPVGYTWYYYGMVWQPSVGQYRLTLTEADVVINTDYNWEAGPIDGRDWNSTNPTPLRPVLLHELGHAAGMEHQNGFPCTMNTTLGEGWYGDGRAGSYASHVPQAHDRASLELGAAPLER